MKMNTLPCVAKAALALLGGVSQVNAQWTVTVLHPVGTLESRSMAVHDARQAGWATVAGLHHAGIWSGTAGSWIDLDPTGAFGSEALAVHIGTTGQMQGGWARVGSTNHAGYWTDTTAASWIDLHPMVSTNSRVVAITSEQQGGWAFVGGVQHASLWSGSAESWIDLHPAGASNSLVYGMDGAIQAGYATIGGGSHASIWNGSAASWIDLHPATGVVHSFAFAIADGQQAGYVRIGVTSRASMWSGTVESRVDLHNGHWSGSWAQAVDGGYQAGWSDDSAPGTARHATLWSGSAGSWVDLGAMLPVEFASSSEATGIFSDGSNLVVTGFGHNTTTGRNEALLWTAATVCYADCDGGGALNIFDYICFGNAYANGDPYADCDGNGVLNIFDYICFGSAYAAGCP